MTKKILIAALAAVTALASCKTQNQPEGTQDVTFDILGLNVSTEAMAPRRDNGTMQDAQLTELWIWEGTTELCHQSSSDEDFGAPTISLSYGSHSLTFVASGKQGQTLTSGVWTATQSIADTYGAVHSIDVTPSTELQTVVLKRATYLLRWTSTDNVPANAATLKVTVSKFHGSVASGLVGANEEAKEFTYSVTSLVGRLLTVNVSGFPTTNDTEETVTTTLTLLDASGNEIVEHSKTVSVLNNRRTIISGALFGWGASAPIQVNTEWEEDEEIAL